MLDRRGRKEESRSLWLRGPLLSDSRYEGVESIWECRENKSCAQPVGICLSGAKIFDDHVTKLVSFPYLTSRTSKPLNPPHD